MSTKDDIFKQLQQDAINALQALENFSLDEGDSVEETRELIGDLSEDIAGAIGRIDELDCRVGDMERGLIGLTSHRVNHQQAVEDRLTRIERAVAGLVQKINPDRLDFGGAVVNGLVDSLFKR